MLTSITDRILSLKSIAKKAGPQRPRLPITPVLMLPPTLPMVMMFPASRFDSLKQPL